MEVQSIEYKQFEGKPKEWCLGKFHLNKINLIVGKNATGKTKTINIINSLGKLLAGEIKVEWLSGNYNVVFREERKEIIYKLKYENKKVINESLKVGRDLLMKRTPSGKGKIYAAKFGKKGKDIEFQVPVNELACVAKRDKVQHPFLERLIKWGQSLRPYKFGTALGKNNLAVFGVEDGVQEINLKIDDHVVAILKKGIKRYPKKFVNKIQKDMAEIGYDIEKISTVELRRAIIGGVSSPAMGISVKEKDLRCNTTQNEMSQGMFRSLSLIIQLNYSQMFSEPSCVLIDDIGEGLDYERATNLIKLLIEREKDLGIQLIMTTNDRFVMNNVPLEYWTIIERIENGARIHNYNKSKKIFKEFEYTGLSNFDFFTGGYYEKGGEGK